MDGWPPVRRKNLFFGWVASGEEEVIFLDGWPLVKRKLFFWMGGLW
jgi:hypothetical protein